MGRPRLFAARISARDAIRAPWDMPQVRVTFITSDGGIERVAIAVSPSMPLKLLHP